MLKAPEVAIQAEIFRRFVRSFRPVKPPFRPLSGALGGKSFRGAR
jgi:hypothetical protein